MMDNMKDKFAQFSGISIMLVSASMTLFTRLVDGLVLCQEKGLLK